jgi:hypothetical protein
VNERKIQLTLKDRILFVIQVNCSAAKTPVSQSRAAGTDSDNEPTPTHWDPSLASMLTM